MKQIATNSTNKEANFKHGIEENARHEASITKITTAAPEESTDFGVKKLD